MIFNIAFAYDPERAKVNLAAEYAACAACYMLGAEAMRRNGDQTAEKMGNDIASTAIGVAITLSNAEVTDARLQLAIETMKREMKDSFSNFVILIRKYANDCKQAMDDPDGRMKYWLDKE